MITPSSYETLVRQHAAAQDFDALLPDLQAGNIEEGVYYGMLAAHYHTVPALSNSGMGDIDVSPYRYWYLTINPNKPAHTVTPAFRLGTAMHAAVLEHDTFLDRYNCRVTKEDFPGCIETVDDIKQWLVQNGGATKWKVKAEYITEAVRISKSSGIPVHILDLEMSRHAAANTGRILLDKTEWEQVNGMARALLSEVALQPILARGYKEVSIFVRDPELGILLKARVDWLHPYNCTKCDGTGQVMDYDGQSKCSTCHGSGIWGGTVVDPKSFSAREYTIDQAVVKALRYNGLIRQAWFYLYVLKAIGLGDFRWINAFVETDAPYEVRLRTMGYNLTRTARYWESTGMRVLELMRIYAFCQKEFGARPWCYQQQIRPLTDSELPGIAYRPQEEID